MLKFLGGCFAITSMILGQIVAWNLISKYLPEYSTMWVVSTVFVWVGLLISSLDGALEK